MTNLHVFTGDAAADTIRAALGIPDTAFLVQHDVISCGPIPDYCSPNDWLADRMGFWMHLLDAEGSDPLPNDLVGESRRLAEAESLTLWIGSGLSDRLLVPTIVRLAEISGLTLPVIRVAEIGTHRSLSVPVLGWGMLRPKDVGEPALRELTGSDLAEAAAAWRALASADPLAVSGFLENVESVALVNAMSTLIERYPDVKTGLSHWDQSLVAALPDAGSSAFAVIGGAIGANHHHLDPVGDVYLFWRLRRMAALREPLVELAGDPQSMRDCQVRLTPFGRRVRDGDRNQAEANGIDDWIGGVHLQSPTGSPWYRRNGELLPRTAL